MADVVVQPRAVQCMVVVSVCKWGNKMSHLVIGMAVYENGGAILGVSPVVQLRLECQGLCMVARYPLMAGLQEPSVVRYLLARFLPLCCTAKLVALMSCIILMRCENCCCSL